VVYDPRIPIGIHGMHLILAGTTLAVPLRPIAERRASGGRRRGVRSVLELPGLPRLGAGSWIGAFRTQAGQRGPGSAAEPAAPPGAGREEPR
jgi:hypothetical protein